MSLEALNLIRNLILESAREENFHLTVDFENYLVEFFRSRFSLIGSLNFCVDLEKKLKEMKKHPEVLKKMIKEAMQLYNNRNFVQIKKRKKKLIEEVLST
jgi:hypothetical protein